MYIKYRLYIKFKAKRGFRLARTDEHGVRSNEIRSTSQLHVPFALQLVLHRSPLQQFEQTFTDLEFTFRLPNICPEAILAHVWKQMQFLRSLNIPTKGEGVLWQK